MKLGGDILGLRLRRITFFGAVSLTTAIGAAAMLGIVRGQGLTPLEVVILGLFVATFAWISVAFWNALIGFGLSVARLDPLSLRRVREPQTDATPLQVRTALVMPIHREDPARVAGGLAAMLDSLERTGEARHFDVHLLSDTTDPAHARSERAAFEGLRARYFGPTGLFYRRRSQNTGRKAGNIQDFCAGPGQDYAFMIVLDADSIMTGTTMVALARALQARPRVGLVQTVPLPARQHTLFGRLIQFAGWLHGPLLAQGQSFWQAESANYWGHNAIVRVEAFREHARLPVLRGRAPWGGEILSHDFVEAAWLRRAGWGVVLLPHLRGSYEEVPSDLFGYATRDRRWAQGSLQHLRLLSEPGLHPLSRLHFALGAMGYVSSALWLLMLLASTVYVLLPRFGADALLDAPHPWLSLGLDRSNMPSLLAITGIVLFLPKALSLILALLREREAFAGSGRLVASALIEAVFAIVIAPVMMLLHARFVFSVLRGRSVPWRPQSRDGQGVSWTRAFTGTAWIWASGLVWCGVTLWFSPYFAIWLSPIFVGLVLAGPLVYSTASPRAGRWMRDRGLLCVPPEVDAPDELRLPSVVAKYPSSLLKTGRGTRLQVSGVR